MLNIHLVVGEFIERFREDSRLRQRAAALVGASLFFAGALYAAGLGQVVLIMVGLAVPTAVIALVVWFVPRDEWQRVRRPVRTEQVQQRLSTFLARAVTSAGKNTLTVLRAWANATTAAARARHVSIARQTQRVAMPISPPTADELYGWPYAGPDETALAPRSAGSRLDETRRRAVELNTHARDLRRAGKPAAAVALHLEALEIFRSLDDTPAQAPTLNSLALALEANGETDAAVERFEQSLSILRERPDDPGQGEVIANLGFTLLRHGDDEHARELLGEALEKLPPESRAARKVEAQLRHAS
jgi:tetratricopeptide (TPR) repeat protein